jgi:rubredoxin
MNNFVKCKACGYVISEKKVKDKCPACGLPKTVFEPFEQKLSKTRWMILNMDLHPIAVHFPQAIAVMLALLIAAGFIFKQSFGPDLIITAKILGFILPFAVAGAFTSGLIDGKTRFKKITTPALIIKMIAGGVLLGLSIGIFIFALKCNCETSRIYILLLSVGCIICEMILGKVGSKLICSKLPG